MTLAPLDSDINKFYSWSMFCALQELQDQRIRKEESEEVQLEKDPTKRFSTFLQAPKRTVPRPKPKTLSIIEDLPWRQPTQQQNLLPQQVNIFCNNNFGIVR